MFTACQMEKLHRVGALHGGEHVQELIERASHEFGIGLHRTVIERQHKMNFMASESSVNDSLPALKRRLCKLEAFIFTQASSCNSHALLPACS